MNKAKLPIDMVVNVKSGEMLDYISHVLKINGFHIVKKPKLYRKYWLFGPQRCKFEYMFFADQTLLGKWLEQNLEVENYEKANYLKGLIEKMDQMKKKEGEL